MPLGVVAGIVPFNFPAMIPWGWMVPLAIATGNTVVLKAASQTPLTSMRILELFYEEAGFPKGVVNLVTCSCPDVLRIRRISVTGEGVLAIRSQQRPWHPYRESKLGARETSAAICPQPWQKSQKSLVISSLPAL